MPLKYFKEHVSGCTHPDKIKKESTNTIEKHVIELSSASDDETVFQYSDDECSIVDKVNSLAVMDVYSDIEDDSDAIDYSEPYVSVNPTQKKIPKEVWDDVEVVSVSAMPYDIDGLKVYKLNPNRNRERLLESFRDGRKWKPDSRTSRAGFKTVRYRHCAGSLTCPNLDCGFYVEFRKQNRVNFDKNGVCNFCAATGLFEECHARKYTAFLNDSEAFVYHIGTHIREAKNINKRPNDVVSAAISSNMGTKPSQIQSTLSLI